jgi:hypothetical protein
MNDVTAAKMQINSFRQDARSHEHLREERCIKREHQPLARLLFDEPIGEPNIRHHGHFFHLAQIVILIPVSFSPNTGLHSV